MHLYQSLFEHSTSEYDAGKEIVKHIHGHLDYDEIGNYFDVDSYSKLGHNSDLRIIHMNAQGLTESKIQSILALKKTLKYQPDVICFSETWFTTENFKSHNILGYNSHHIVRETRAHGGVSVYISNSIKSNQIKNISFINEEIEINTIEIYINDLKYIICALYRPKFKYDDIDLFSHELEKVLNDRYIKKDKIIILGDFNINLLEHNSHNPTDEFLSSMQSSRFWPHICHPTRFPTGNQLGTPALLDHVYTNFYDNIHAGIIYFDISDH